MQTTPGAPLTGPEPTSPPPDTVHETTAASPQRSLGLLAVTAVAVVVVDAVTKALVVSRLSGRPPIRLLGGFLQLTETRNSGAAFSIGTGATVVFTVVAVAVVVAIVRTARRLRSIPWALVLGLLLGGAIGNLADRVFRSPGPLRGQVVDWIQLPHWPVFNLADSAIVVGGLAAVVLATTGVAVEGRAPLPPE